MLDAILAQSRNTALIMGLIAMIGLLLQKKHATDVISGTMKTVIGFMVNNIASSAISGVVQTFTYLFIPILWQETLPFWISFPPCP